MITEKLKFYADTPRGEKNKFFCWNVSILQLEEALYRFFARGFVIRAAWYETINTETGVHENTRIRDLQGIFDRFCQLPPNKQRFYINVPLKNSYYHENKE
jgi:hypothetical protein